MRRQLIFVHGRAQQNQDAATLKRQWVESFREGLEKNGLELPLDESDIRFPYYGDTLDDLVQGIPDREVARVIVRGAGVDEQETLLIRQILLEIQREYGITDEQVQKLAGPTTLERGILNWEWVHTVLQAIDRIPGASSVAIALATKDVARYLRNPGIQNVIESGVRSAFAAGVETVVVGHSLGSVVSYNLLRREGHALGWNVPLYLTVGAPLGVRAIRRSLAPTRHPPCVSRWFNAMDERDVVALYPLEEPHFLVEPEIENKTDVDNRTDNHHGIAGYLSDRQVAKRIYDALTAPVPPGG